MQDDLQVGSGAHRRSRVPTVALLLRASGLWACVCAAFARASNTLLECCDIDDAPLWQRQHALCCGAVSARTVTDSWGPIVDQKDVCDGFCCTPATPWFDQLTAAIAERYPWSV